VNRTPNTGTRRENKVSDFNTYEIVVKVAMRVSAYDEEHAVNVASELLSPVAGVMFVKNNNFMNMQELNNKLKELHKYSLGRYEELENAFDNEDYEEELTDTLIRKYEEGYSDAIAMVLTSLKENN
jgi:hypothetical protein